MDISAELTESKEAIEGAIADRNRGILPHLDHQEEEQLQGMTEEKAVMTLRNCVARKQVHKALQLLHFMR